MKSKIIILCLLLSFSLDGCGKNKPDLSPPDDIDTSTVADEATDIPFDIESYKNTISSYCEAVMDESLILYNMGRYQYSYWENLDKLQGNIDYDSLVSNTYDWLAKENEMSQDDIENNYSEICALYQEITIIDGEKNDIEEIQTAIKDLHSTFESFYHLITNPSGDIESFATHFNDYVTEIKAQNDNISVLIE